MNKVHRIVEFVRSCGDFPHDCDDVIENLGGILTGYGIYDILDREEYYLLMDELLEIAQDTEISEAVWWASLRLVCGQYSGSDYRIPGFV